jgi:hypothetical protein
MSLRRLTACLLISALAVAVVTRGRHSGVRELPTGLGAASPVSRPARAEAPCGR